MAQLKRQVPGVSDLLAMVREGNDQPSKAQQLVDVLSYLVSEVASLRAAAEANTNLSSLVAAGGVTPVVSPTGIREVDVSGLPGAYVGQLVRIREGRAEVPSFTDIGTLGGASGIIVQVLNGGRTAVVARSAAMAPMRVSSPVVGEEVLLYNSGTGTCSVSDLTSVSPSAETQVVGICDSATLDANGCVRVLNVEFGGGYEFADLSGLFIRMAYDNSAPNRTGLVNTLLEGTTGAPFGTLFDIRNLGGIGANGLAVEMPNGGTGNGIVVNVTGAMTGINSLSEEAVSGSFFNDSAVAFALWASNNNVGGRHAQFGSDMYVIGTSLYFHSEDPATGAVVLTAAVPSGPTRYQSLIDGDGPIPQLGLSLATASGANLP